MPDPQLQLAAHHSVTVTQQQVLKQMLHYTSSSHANTTLESDKTRQPITASSRIHTGQHWTALPRLRTRSQTSGTSVRHLTRQSDIRHFNRASDKALRHLADLQASDTKHGTKALHPRASIKHSSTDRPSWSRYSTTGSTTRSGDARHNCIQRCLTCAVRCQWLAVLKPEAAAAVLYHMSAGRSHWLTPVTWL